MRAPSIIAVTGTDTDVGKTVVTAAIAAALRAAGRTVAAYKPVQTGVRDDDDGDMQVLQRLTGADADVAEGVRLTEPMAPRPAAAIDGVPLPSLDVHARWVRDAATRYDHALVEGAGGVLVELTDDALTIADLAGAVDAPCVVVTRPVLGTLNHTLLTLEALARRGVPVLGIVIGAWPSSPNRLEVTNRDYLAGLDVPLLGAVPAGAPALPDFAARAPSWLSGFSR